MDINRKNLDEAVDQGIISSQQSEALFQFLADKAESRPRFIFTHVLYYLGGLIAIGAMTLFMNLAWESFGGAGIFFIALAYAGVGLKLTHHFQQRELPIPAGLCATFVVCLTPLAIYGLQQWLGVWPDDSVYRDYHRYIQWHWLFMELGTLAVGVLVAWKYKYPFLIMPIALTLWYLTMDLTSVLTGGEMTWELRALVSLYSGLLVIGIAFWVDIRSRHTADYAFWLYLFGVVAFWGGLSAQESDSELSKFLYFCINLLMIGVGVLLVRRVFVIFGALGSCGYLGYLASNVFQDSVLFPVMLTAIGLGIIYLGVLWQRHEKAISQTVRARMPMALQELLESKDR
ncbi:DUF2157 domain-containing protein [Marinobacter adhaerens]|uniref:DUF2157 domain-containing protein n=1 Tax=Marinobacter adhaerens TaxID=1033846 RepID=A0ABX8IMD2_9GAMM|nr:DUF2157 domain-containing protein [Marinobacter adhaerens]QWV14997.1 DUF2157 domain-containing protein [Marinobacter adhaerens]